MSKKRNRNIRHKFGPPTGNNPDEIMTADSKELVCFGEPVPSRCEGARNFLGNKFWEQIPDFYCCTGDSVFDNASIDKSSSSSLSWGEECETEATLLVQREYDRMIRVLQGTEEIPPHYNKDEYKLWIKTFPCLRSTDTRPKARNRIRFSEELTDQDLHCDKLKNSQHDVINDVFGETIALSSSRGRKRSYENRGRNRKQENDRVRDLEHDFEKFLRISPAPISMKPSRNSRCIGEHSPEFVSLPYLPPSDISRDNNNTSAKTRISNSINRGKKFAVGERRMFELPSPNKDNNIILPPIGNTQFRSVSAVHLQPSARSSTASTRVNLKKKPTNKIDVTSLNNNSLLKGHSENKSIKRYCCN